jgi:hypothetical protein
VRLCALKVRPRFIVVTCLRWSNPYWAKELLDGVSQSRFSRIGMSKLLSKGPDVGFVFVLDVLVGYARM